MFRPRGGGSIGFYTNRGEEPNFSIFRSPLDQKEAIGVVFRSMDPPQAILEPRRVRVTLIPGSTLMRFSNKMNTLLEYVLLQLFHNT